MENTNATHLGASSQWQWCTCSYTSKFRFQGKSGL